MPSTPPRTYLNVGSTQAEFEAAAANPGDPDHAWAVAMLAQRAGKTATPPPATTAPPAVTPRSARRRAGRLPDVSQRRELRSWFRAPRQPFDPDLGLSAHGKLIAFAIASKVNGGVWNVNLEASVSYTELAALAGISRTAAIAAVADLRRAEVLEKADASRVGRNKSRFRFTDYLRTE
jgi:hypothetical protein